MNKFDNLCKELKATFQGNTFTRVLLPLDVLIVLGSGATLLLNTFLNLGALVGFVSFYALILGIVLSFANKNFLFTYGGLFIYAGINILDIVLNGVFREYRYFDTGSFLCVLLYGYLGYVLFKQVEATRNCKSVKGESTEESTEELKEIQK